MSSMVCTRAKGFQDPRTSSPWPSRRDCPTRSAPPGGDQPGARIEGHAALVAVVRREHLAQALDGAGRLAARSGSRGPRSCSETRGRTRARRRGRVRRGPARGRPRSAAQSKPARSRMRRGGFGIAERERVRARRRRWLRRVAQRGVDRQRPFVVLAALPDEQHQARLGAKGGGDVGERGGRIGEEHRPEAADRHVEAGGVEAMHLGVAELVRTLSSRSAAVS